MGNHVLCLERGSNFSFVLFHRCILRQNDPRLNRLNIHVYSEENESLEITDISCVRCLVGRIGGGPDPWAIIDRSGGFAREAYLTNEVG